MKLIVQNKSQLINVSFITMEQVWESGEAAILSGYINSILMNPLSIQFYRI